MKSIQATNKEQKEKRLYTDVEYIVEQIIDNIDGVVSIYLCGGYGRDEGAWIIENDEVLPYNDYDFVVITDSAVEREKLNSIRKECADAVGIHWVDIDIYTIAKINRLKNTQKNVDLAFASKLVYGEDVINRAYLSASKLGFEDIEVEYFTRLWTFWGTACLLKKTELSKEESVFFNNQMAKAILACVDCVLIKHNLYDTSYVERVNRILKLNIFSNYQDDFKWALNQKLEPSMETLDKSVVLKRYKRTMHMYKEVMEYSFEHRWRGYVNVALFRCKTYLKPVTIAYFVYSLLRGRYITAKRNTEIRCIQNELFQLVTNNQLDKLKDIETKLDKLGKIL